MKVDVLLWSEPAGKSWAGRLAQGRSNIALRCCCCMSLLAMSGLGKALTVLVVVGLLGTHWLLAPLMASCDSSGSGSSIADVPAASGNKERILVVYSGPASLDETKHVLYEKNLDFFLANGGADCSNHDTVIVVGHDYYARYAPVVDKMNSQCAKGNDGQHFVRLVARRPQCKDMETARLAFYGGLGVDIQQYDYFVYANCGVTGPAYRHSPADGKSWTMALTSKLNDRVKMSGLSLNCEPPDQEDRAHIQSMVYALDRKGIQLIHKANCPADCLEDKSASAIGYERCMGKVITNEGYGLAPIIVSSPGMDVLTNDNKASCQAKDPWMGSRLREIYGGELPKLEDVVFFKTSRLLPEDIAKRINYTDKINWNWD